MTTESQQQDASAILVSIDETRASLIAILRATDGSALTERPASGEWSVVENVRHLLFAEQLHLGKHIPNRPAWSATGLTPHFFAEMPAFREVGTKPTSDLDEVLAEWDAIHAPLASVVGSPSDDLVTSLQGNLQHLQFHAGIIESLLRERV
jgi:hypothetical protein